MKMATDSITNRRVLALGEKAHKFGRLLGHQFAQRLRLDTGIRKGGNVLIYDPYLSTLGGGERYIFALAAYLQQNCEVTIAGPVLPSL